MKNTESKNFLLYAIAVLLCFPQAIKAREFSLRQGFSYDYPKNYDDWEDSFLSGNGKMGIMVFGNPLDETVVFNDRGFNLAKKRDRSFAEVPKPVLDSIRQFCVDGEFVKANKLAVESAQWKNGGEGNRHPGFLMKIEIPQNGKIKDYKRICNFRTGEIIVSWTDNRGKWERRSFVSRKDNVAVQYLTAPSKARISCSIRLDIDPKMNFPRNMLFTKESAVDYLAMRVKYDKERGGAGYEGVTRVLVSGGEVILNGDVLNISDAKSVLLLTRTQKYYENSEEYWAKGEIQKQLSNLFPDYQKLLGRHTAEHGTIYDRVKLDLNAPDKDRSLSNEKLLEIQQQSDYPVMALWERIFDAGRYYFLSSSSELTPPDLLGIWTGDCQAGWGGFYHLDANLNLQVSSGNIAAMPEAMEGYFKINEAWRDDFRLNARNLLGCRGLLACGNTPGQQSGLMAGINDYYPYQYATGEEPWLLYPFWEYFLVTGDTDFLEKRLYPMLKELGHFYEDFLTHVDANGRYIFAGSVSPENQPSNLKVSLLNNSNFDISGAKFALSALLESCRILGKKEGVEIWSGILEKLPPYLINSDGALQEWSWPGLKDNYQHRHSSQLMMIWPYREITPENDKRLFDAAVRTFELKDRFEARQGHDLLHRALIAAGLKNGKAVEDKLLSLTRNGFYYSTLASSHNEKHAIFCTDVCNSLPSIILEMLVSSMPEQLELLPALPPSLSKGSVSGIRGRNRVIVENLDWDMARRQIRCVLRSDIDQTLTLIVRDGIASISTKAYTEPSSLGNIARKVHLKKGVKTALVVHVANK